eukprot:scaffold206764_cov19-Tisochrysis_lutea.AAC.3
MKNTVLFWLHGALLGEPPRRNLATLVAFGMPCQMLRYADLYADQYLRPEPAMAALLLPSQV